MSIGTTHTVALTSIYSRVAVDHVDLTVHHVALPVATLHDGHAQSCYTIRNYVSGACVFISGIDFMLGMHRLAWERADCAAGIIASHRLRSGG